MTGVQTCALPISTGVPVALELAAVEPPVAVRYELCRILQEALRNAASHAAPTAVTVRLSARPGRVELRVADDGRGFEPAVRGSAEHYGIRGMRERARAAGGSLRVLSTPGRGTAVEADIPAAPA